MKEDEELNNKRLAINAEICKINETRRLSNVSGSK